MKSLKNTKSAKIVWKKIQGHTSWVVENGNRGPAKSGQIIIKFDSDLKNENTSGIDTINLLEEGAVKLKKLKVKQK